MNGTSLAGGLNQSRPISIVGKSQHVPGATPLDQFMPRPIASVFIQPSNVFGANDKFNADPVGSLGSRAGSLFSKGELQVSQYRPSLDLFNSPATSRGPPQSFVPPIAPLQSIVPTSGPLHPIVPTSGPPQPIVSNSGPPQPIVSNSGPPQPIVSNSGPPQPIITSIDPLQPFVPPSAPQPVPQMPGAPHDNATQIPGVPLGVQYSGLPAGYIPASSWQIPHPAFQQDQWNYWASTVPPVLAGQPHWLTTGSAQLPQHFLPTPAANVFGNVPSAPLPGPSTRPDAISEPNFIEPETSGGNQYGQRRKRSRSPSPFSEGSEEDTAVVSGDEDPQFEQEPPPQLREVIAMIRKECGLEEAPPLKKFTAGSVFERKVLPQRESLPSFLLPWSENMKEDMKKLNAEIASKEIAFSEGRATKLIPPPLTRQRRFYHPEEAPVGPASFSKDFASLIGSSIENVRKEPISFSSTETSQLIAMISSAAATSSWLENWVGGMGRFLEFLPEVEKRNLEAFGLCAVKALRFQSQQLITSWANFELRRRDAVFAHNRHREVREILPELRQAPVFLPQQFPEAVVKSALERKSQSVRDNALYSRPQSYHNKRKSSSSFSSGAAASKAKVPRSGPAQKDVGSLLGPYPQDQYQHRDYSQYQYSQGSYGQPFPRKGGKKKSKGRKNFGSRNY